MSSRGEMGSSSVWVVEHGGEGDTERLSPNDRGYSEEWKRLCLWSRWTIVCGVLGSGCWESPCAQGGPFFISYFTSLSLLNPGFCEALFCLVLCCVPSYISFLLTFSHTKQFFFPLPTMYLQIVVCCLRNEPESCSWQEKNAASSCPSLFSGRPFLED